LTLSPAVVDLEVSQIRQLFLRERENGSKEDFNSRNRNRRQASAMAYLSAKNPEALKACAIKAGIEFKELAGFMLSGDDTPGAAAEALKPLADAGVNSVAASAVVCNSGYGMIIIVESADADAAAEALGA
jgi:hypothetical protein